MKTCFRIELLKSKLNILLKCQDLYQDAKSNLSGKFSKVIRSLLRPPFEFLASDIKKAMAGHYYIRQNMYNTFEYKN